MLDFRYEIGLNIYNGNNIVWAFGGFPCGAYPDIKIARELYVNMVDPGEMTVADDGYRDGNYFIYPQANLKLFQIGMKL